MRPLVSLVLVCLFASMTSAKAQDGDKTLRIGIIQEFDSINPLAASMLSAMYIYNLIGRNLISLNRKMVWEPQLSEEIPSLKNKLAQIKTIDGKKRLVAIWNLKKNAKWGDGVDITCEDAKFSWTVGLSNLASVINRDVYAAVRSITCDPAKPKKIEMVYEMVRWDFYQMFHFYFLPKHLEEPVFKKYENEKQGYDRNTNYVKDPTLPGLYSGPFVISEVKLGSHVLVKRNPMFYGKRPYFDKILIRLIPDTSALEANLVSKQIDMVSSLGFNIDQVLNLEKRITKENLPLSVQYLQGLTYEHIDINLDNPVLKSKNVRKALLISIDRERMAQAMFERKQKVAPHFMSSRDPHFAGLPKKLQQPLAYSKKDAEKLLDAEGWKMGAEGFRYKDGKKLSLVFTTTSANRLRESVQTYIIDQWKKIGIEVTTKNVVARVFFSELMKTRTFEGLSMFAWSLLPEMSMAKFYSSKAIPSDANGWAGRNYSGFSMPKMDELLEKYEVEMDIEKRQSLMNQIVEIYVLEHITIPLFNRVDVSVTPKNLKGYYLTGTQQVETLYAEEWYY